MRRPKIILAALCCLAFVASSCVKLSHVHPKGPVRSNTISLGNFDRISASGDIDLYISNGIQKVEVQAPENIHEFLVIEVKGGELSIYPRPGVSFWGDPDIKLNLSIDHLRSIHLSGSGDCHLSNYQTEEFSIKASGSSDAEGSIKATSIKFDTSGSTDCDLNIDCDKLETRSSGSGQMEFKGRADVHYANFSGSVRMKALPLQTKSLNLKASGSFWGEVSVSDRIDVDLSGSGELRYRGNPEVQSKLTGFSSVKKIP